MKWKCGACNSKCLIEDSTNKQPSGCPYNITNPDWMKVNQLHNNASKKNVIIKCKSCGEDFTIKSKSGSPDLATIPYCTKCSKQRVLEKQERSNQRELKLRNKKMVSKYEVTESVTRKGNIIFNSPGSIIAVTPPSWFERIRGITFEHKVIKARAKMQAECDKLNKRIEEAEKLAHETKLDLSNPPQGGSGLPSKTEV